MEKVENNQNQAQEALKEELEEICTVKCMSCDVN